MTHPLSNHVEEPMSPERLEGIWQGIDRRRAEFQPSRRRERALLFGGGLAVALGVALFLGFAPDLRGVAQAPLARMESDTGNSESAALRTGSEKMSVDLKDGSRVTLLAHSRVSVDETETDNVTLSLGEGRVSCEVVKNKGRVFSVLAGPVSVRVVGTKFFVERQRLSAGEKVVVDVQEGVVEVRGPDGVEKRLSAGESWSLTVGGEQDGTEAQAAALTPVTTPEPGSAPAIPKKGELSLPDLFSEARALRNSGDAKGAARLYQEFLEKAARDPRVGVAALELGRLRMDQLGDPAGALSPLRKAAERGAGSLGDDALARLAEAHARLGQVSACREVRASYLRSYPEGVHVKQVRALCP